MFPRLHFSLERWKKNKEYDVYVSNYGNIRSCKDKSLIEQRISNKGYSVVFTKNGAVPVHRLVGETWLQKTKEDGNTIDHIDNNKRNNSVKNLRWLSAKLNCEYSLYKSYTVEEQESKIKKETEKSLLIENIDYADNLLAAFKVSNDYTECGKILQALLESKIAFLVVDEDLLIRRIHDVYRKGVFIGGGNNQNKKTLFEDIARAIKRHGLYKGRMWALKLTASGDLIQDV